MLAKARAIGEHDVDGVGWSWPGSGGLGAVGLEPFPGCDRRGDLETLEPPAITGDRPNAREEARPERGVFKRLAAARLGNKVDALIRRCAIDAQSPAADALRDFRRPSQTEQSNRLGALEDEVEWLRFPVVAKPERIA